MSSFLDQLNSAIQPNLDAVKSKLLQQKTDQKEYDADPQQALLNSLARTVKDDYNTAILDAYTASNNAAIQQQQADQTLAEYTNSYNPDSPENKDKLYTQGEIRDSSLFSVPTAVNTALGIYHSLGTLGSNIITAPINNNSIASLQHADPAAVTVYAKYQKNKALQQQYNNLTKQQHQNIQNGKMPTDADNLQMLALKKQLNDSALTDSEMNLLNAKVPDMSMDDTMNNPYTATQLAGKTNLQLIEQSKKQSETAKKLPDKIYNFIPGMNTYNSANSNDLQQSIANESKQNVPELTSLADSINNGDITGTVKNGLTSLAKTIYIGLTESAKNPKSALSAIAENFAPSMAAAFGPAGITASAAQSIGIASQMATEGVQKFVDEKGRMPTSDEFEKIVNWSAIGGTMDFTSDLILGRVGKGLTKAFEKTPTRSIEEIQATAINQPLTEQAQAIKTLADKQPGVMTQLAKKIAQTGLNAGKTASIDALTEGSTEGAQQIIDDYTSELRPVGDLSDSAVAAAIGAVSGIGMHPMHKIVSTTAKAGIGVAKLTSAIGSATAEGIKNTTTPKSEYRSQIEDTLRGSADKDFIKNVDSAVENNDVSAFIDPSNSTYKPAVAIAALAKMNTSDNISTEDKANNLNKAIEIGQDFNVERMRRKIQTDALENKVNDKTITPDERRQLRDLRAIMPMDDRYHNELSNTISSMSETQSTPADLRKRLQDAKLSESPEETDSILKEIFGSSGGSDIYSFGSDLRALQQNTYLSDAAKDVLTNAEQLSQVQQIVNDNVHKTTENVHSDIFNGGPGYRGIASYLKSITAALEHGNVQFANDELNKMQSFAKRHQDKYDTLSSLPDGQSVKLGKRAYTADSTNDQWNNILNNIHNESDALNKGVSTANSLFGLYKQKPNNNKTMQQESVKAETSLPENSKSDSITESALNKTYDHLSDIELQAAADRKRTKAESYPENSVIRNNILTEAAHYEQILKDRQNKQKLNQAESVKEPEQKPVEQNTKTDSKSIEQKPVPQMNDKGTPLSKQEVSELAQVKKSTLVPNAMQGTMKDGRTAVRLVDKTGKPTSEWKTYEKPVEIIKPEPVKKELVQQNKTVQTESPVKNQPKPSAIKEQDNGKEILEKGQGREGLLNQPVDEEKATTKTNSSSEQDLSRKNKVVAFLTVKPVKNGVMHIVRMTDMISRMKLVSDQKNLSAIVNDTNYQTTNQDTNLVQSLAHFAQVFTDAATRNLRSFAQSAPHLTYRDAIQDMLMPDGKSLDPIVTNAMSAVVYKWIATQGRSTLFNDNRALASILGLKNEKINDIYGPNIKYLREIGSSQNYLVDSLGSEIYRLIGFKAKNTAPEDFETRVKAALGMYALSTLEHLGYIQSVKVFTDALNIISQSITKPTIDNSKPLSIADIIKSNNKSFTGKENEKSYTKFYRITPASDKTGYIRNEHGLLQLNSTLQSIPEKWHDANRIWDAIFTANPNTKSYSFKKPVEPIEGSVFIKGTDQPVSAEQAKNLYINTSKGWTLNHTFAQIFSLLTPQQSLDLQGFSDPAEHHESVQDAIQATNDKYQRDIDAYHDFITDAVLHTVDGIKSVFYIPVQFINNTRMMQQGVINPQGSKLHRFLFQMPEWTQTINTKDSQMIRKFKEGVALAFDIETVKNGGIENTLKLLDAKLKQPEFINAINSLMNIHDKISAYDLQNTEHLQHAQEEFKSDIETIMQAVKLADTNAAALKGLIEYAKYKTALKNGDKTFDTTLTTELDGSSNGTVIGRIQMLFKKSLRAMAILRSGGFILSDKQGDLGKFLSDPANLDPYQITGMAWNHSLESRINVLINKSIDSSTARMRAQNKQDLNRILAAKRLFGEFGDENGFIQKFVRKLTKNPTTITLYGSGDASIDVKLTKVLLNDFIVPKIEEIAQISNGTEAQDKLQKLIDDVNTTANLQGNSKLQFAAMKLPNNIINADGSTNKNAILHTKIPPAITSFLNDYISNFHGAALHDAIHSIYGDMIEGRKPFNTGFNLVTAMYNAAFKYEANKLRNQHNTPIVLTTTQKGKQINQYADLSIEDIKHIKDKLKNLFPRLKTPFDSYIDIAEESYKRNYNNEDTFNDDPNANLVIQSYGPTNNTDKSQHFASQNIYHVPGYAGLTAPGVSPMVRAIQMIDATVSNILQGTGVNILNNHDGFFTPITEAQKVNNNVNEAFYNIVKNYSVLSAAHDSIQNTIKDFSQYLQQESIDQKQINTLIAEQLINFGIKAIPNGIDSKDNTIFIKVTPESIANIQSALSKQMQNRVIEANSNKNAILNHTLSINQYYYFSGGYKINSSNLKIDHNDYDTYGSLDDKSKKDIKSQADNVAKLHTENEINIRKLFDDEINQELGSGNETISSNPDDYNQSVELTRQNVDSIYNTIKNTGNVQVTPEQDASYKDLLRTLIGKVLNPTNLFYKLHENTETAGLFTPNNNGKDSIFLQTDKPSGMLAQGINMSAGEVYMHELIHAVTQYGLKVNSRLRRQVQQLYNIAKTKLNTNGEGFRVFLNDPTIDIHDPLNGYVVDQAKQRWDYLFEHPWIRKVNDFNTATNINNVREYSQHLDEFLTHAITNQQFKIALHNIELSNYNKAIFKSESWRGLIKSNIHDTLVSIFSRLTDMIMHNFSSQIPANRMDDELKRLAYKLADINDSHKSYAARALAILDSRSSQLAQFMNAKIKKQFSKLKLAEFTSDMRRRMENKDSHTGQILRDYRRIIDSQDYGMMQSIATNIVGLTDRVHDLHMLLNKKTLTIDQAREEAVTTVMSQLRKEWGRDLANNEKIAVLKAGIKTDLDALRGTFTMEDIHSLVNPIKSNAGQAHPLEQAIAGINQQMLSDSNLAPYANYFHRQARSLGHFLVTGVAKESVTFLNARTIAELKNTQFEGKLDTEHIAKAEELVDQLASLYAIRYTPETQRSTLSNLMNENLSTVESVLQLHRDLQLDAQDSLFNGLPYQIIKGYTKEILDPRINIKYGTKDMADQLAEEGFTNSGNILAMDPNDPQQAMPIYMYVARTGIKNNLLSSIASFTGKGAKGTDITTGTMLRGYTRSAGGTNTVIMHKRKMHDLNAMFTEPMHDLDLSVDTPNFAVPVTNDKGDITGYRYMMREATKDDVLHKVNNYDTVLGSMAGQIKDKLGTTLINNELIHALKDLYDKEHTDRFSKYVEISPYTDIEWHREIYNMLPEDAKKEIQRVWGNNKMYVAKDVVDLAFGTRRYSLAEAFDKDPEARNFFEKSIVSFTRYFFGNKAIKNIKESEEVMRSLVRTAKNNIIVKSLKVTLDNHISNLLYCRSNGVGYSDIIKYKREAIVGAAKYQTDMQALREAEIALAMNQGKHPNQSLTQRQINMKSNKLKTLIREKKNELALNPISKFMDTGLMQSIVDDLNLSKEQSPFPDLVEETANKIGKYVPSPMMAFGKQLFLAHDTQAYKILDNAVKMTDFIGRYIMYKHYTNSTNPAIHLEHEQAIAKVISEFVNLNLPMHRGLEYLNSTLGVLWFTKYALGILKPIQNTIKTHPFESLISFAFSHHLGLSNIFNAMPFITKNPLRLVGNPISTFYRSYDSIATVHGAESAIDTLLQ